MAMGIRGFSQLRPHLVAALLLGVVSQVAQVLLLRELLVAFYGSEFSIGIILASWMAWVGVGSRLGGVLAPRFRRPGAALAVASAGVVLVLPATLLLARSARGFFSLLPGEYLSLSSTVGVCLLLMAPACVLLGAHFVILSRIWREREGAEGVASATGTYVWEATGTLVGGVVFSLALVHLLNSFQAAVFVGALLPAATLRLMRGSPGSDPHLTLDQPRGEGRGAPLRARGARRVSAGGALLAASVVGLSVGLVVLEALDGWAHRLHWASLAPHQELVETRQSKYGLISVGRQGGQYSFFQSGHLAFSTGAEQEEDFELEESAGAVLAHFAMVQHPRPRRVLLLGGGLRGVLREIARHPVEEIHYVELDRVLVDAALNYVPVATREALEDPRVRVVTADGRHFLHTARGRYDLVIVDVPDPATAVLNRFYTVEFFREVRGLLEPGGVLVTGISSTADLRSRAMANRNATLYHTLRSVFSHVFAVGDTFCYFFASDDAGQASPDPGVLRDRYRERGVEARGFSEGYFFTLLQEAPLLRLNWVLRHHGRSAGPPLDPPETGPLFPPALAEQEAAEGELAPVQERFFINSDLRPIGYYYTLVLWHALTGSGQTRVMDAFLRVRLWWALPVAGAGLVILLLLRSVPPFSRGRNDARLGLLFAILATGFSTMTLQVALLFSFQSVYGFVYEMVGLIVALFMGGLALGAALAHRLVERKADRRPLALVQLLVALYAVVVAVGLPLSAAAGSTWVTFALFSALTFCGGVLNGAGFPLAISCTILLGDPPERATGTVYGNELVGGCLGALVAGVVVAPVLGVVACCLLAGAMNATAFVLIVGGRRSSWAGGGP
jgi:spermidine synthase